MNRVIIDTGPLVALLDKSEKNHDRCTEWFKNYHGRLFTTEAVLTEAMYLMNFSLKAQIACLNFFIFGAIEIIPTALKYLEKIRKLMEKYEDIPMDFADATLVNLSIELKCFSIFTLDTKDFSIYKPTRNIRYKIFPD